MQNINAIIMDAMIRQECKHRFGADLLLHVTMFAV
jgi:hypothetical protein